MGLLVTEINELRQRLKNFDAGKVEASELGAVLSVYAQTEKRMRLYIQSMAIGMKLGIPVDSDMLRQMVGGSGDVIDVTKELENRTSMRGRNQVK